MTHMRFCAIAIHVHRKSMSHSTTTHCSGLLLLSVPPRPDQAAAAVVCWSGPLPKPARGAGQLVNDSVEGFTFGVLGGYFTPFSKVNFLAVVGAARSATAAAIQTQGFTDTCTSIDNWRRQFGERVSCALVSWRSAVSDQDGPRIGNRHFPAHLNNARPITGGWGAEGQKRRRRHERALVFELLVVLRVDGHVE